MNQLDLAQSAEPSTGVAVRESAAQRYLPIAVRILLGLGFTITGLDGFLHFFPKPAEPPPPAAAAFAAALAQTPYFFKLIKGTELVSGLLLLSNQFVPLALVLLAPVLVNILAFHAFLAPSGIGPGAFLTVLALVLAWQYRGYYRSLFARRARPGAR